MLRKAYSTEYGTMYRGTVESFLASARAEQLKGKVHLIFTSPPFPLNRKKRYGNLQGDEYIKWLAGLAKPLSDLLHTKGSLVMEIGNAWEPGRPVMSTLALRAMLAFLQAGGLSLCQQFVCYNPARLPSPAQWVNVERIRVKDAYTHVWWMAPSDHPRANNRRVLIEYSDAMKKLLLSQKYNAGPRPSEHRIGAKSFLSNNGGAIPSNVLTFSNTSNHDPYLKRCRRLGITPHPARMQPALADFFIRFLTSKRSWVFDPFAGSNTTGAVAEALERRWLAVEPNRDYVRTSRSRFVSAGRLTPGWNDTSE